MVKKTRLNNLASKLLGGRIWIHTAFLLVWLDPLGLRWHTMCSPVFHCYACPLATFACPIGVLAQFSALHVFPFMAIGLLVAFGAAFAKLEQRCLLIFDIHIHILEDGVEGIGGEA